MRVYTVMDFDHLLLATTDKAQAREAFEHYSDEDMDDSDSDWITLHIWENGEVLDVETRHRGDN